MQERLKYAVVTNGNSAGTVLMTWEKVKISLPFKMKE
jgi:hypothetical protein